MIHFLDVNPRYREHRQFTPEMNLIAEVIWRAICDLTPTGKDPSTTCGRKPKKPLAERWKRDRKYHRQSKWGRRRVAARWIESNLEEKFTFVWCCKAIGFDPEQVRRYAKGL